MRCQCGEHLAVVDHVAGLAIWLTLAVHSDEHARTWSATCARCGVTWAGTAAQLEHTVALAHRAGRCDVSVQMATPPTTPPTALLAPTGGTEHHGSGQAPARQRAVTV